MAHSNSIVTMGSFSPSLNDIAPFSPIPDDVISLFFSLLSEIEKTKLGRVCKTLNAIYLKVSSVGFGCKQLYANLKDVALELTKATQERPLTGREFRRGLSLPPMSPEAQGDVEQLVLKADNELANFFNKFGNTLKALTTTPTPESSGIFAALANKMIKSSFKNGKVDEAKLATVIQEFNLKYFHDLCALYGSQPIDTLTIESFKAKVASIKQWFAWISQIKVETALRQAINAKHDTAELDKISQEYLNLAPDSPRFVAIRAAIAAELLAEKNDPQALLEYLRSSNKLTDTDEAGWKKRQQANEASLQPAALDVAARKEANNIAAFYNELRVFVSEVNEKRRSLALHEIIGY